MLVAERETRTEDKESGVVSRRGGVCFLSYCPAIGGTASFQSQHIGFLVRRGIPVTLAAPESDATTMLLSVEDRARIRLETIPFWTHPLSTQIRVITLLRSIRPELIVLNNFGVLIKLFPALLLLRLVWGRRLLEVVHSRTFIGSLKNWTMELAAAALFIFVSDLVFVSNFTRTSWVSRFPWLRLRKARVVRNGVFCPEQVTERKVGASMRIGFVGRLWPEKDPELFCRVAERFGQGSAPIEFHVFGEGPLLPGLKESYGKLVRFHGPKLCKKEIYSSMDLLLVTSVVENSPFAVLEAKSFGVPCVAPAIGGLPEIIEDGMDGILVRSRTIDHLSDGLETALNGLESLRKGCAVRRSQFDFVSSAARLWQKILPASHDGSV